MRIDTHELAWAAGFFDGEGTISSRSQRKNLGKGACISVSQVYKEPLIRFQQAVFGLGKIYGPYCQKSRKHSAYFVWSATKHETVQAVVAALWKFLGPRKREQIKEALKFVTRPSLKPGPKRGARCKRGHLMSRTRYIRPNGEAGSCLACAELRRRRSL